MLVLPAWLGHIRFYTNNINTVGCSYNMVQYSMILYTSLQWLKWNKNQNVNPQKDTPYLTLTDEL